MTIENITEADELAWITEHDARTEPWRDYVCAARFHAVYGRWPDGEPVQIDLTAYPQKQADWLKKQSDPDYWRIKRYEIIQRRVVQRAVDSVKLPPKESYPGHFKHIRDAATRKGVAEARKLLKPQNESTQRRNLLIQIRSEITKFLASRDGFTVRQRNAAASLANYIATVSDRPTITADDFIGVVMPGILVTDFASASSNETDSLCADVVAAGHNKPLPIALSPLGKSVLRRTRRGKRGARK